MKVIPLPNNNGNDSSMNNESIKLTQKEYDRYIELQKLLANSFSPGQTQYYKNELDGLIVIGRTRKNTTKWNETSE